MNFAIVGAGAISHLRKAAIEELPDGKLGGVLDIDAARAADLAGGSTVYPDLDALLGDAGIDTVIICTPTDTHERLAVAALEAGKNVLVEKPMSNSLESCMRMLDAARRAGRLLTVGFNHRYFPAIKAVREAAESGKIGEISHVRGYAGHAGLAEFKAEWMYDKKVMGGGALFDNGIHMLDLVHHLLGPVETVTGQITSRSWGLEAEDNAYALLKGQNGALGTLGASWTEWRGYHFYVEVYGTRGMARAYYAPMKFELITMDKPGGAPNKTTNRYLPLIFKEKFKGWQTTAIQTFVEELTDFVALAEGRTATGPIARAEDGVRSIEIAKAVYRSAGDGQAVTLAEKL